MKIIKTKQKLNKGFTLIELLIVIAVIGLISVLALVAVKNAKDKAKTAKLKADFKQIYTAADQAREIGGKVDVTGSGCSCCACINRGNLSILPDTHQCIINYKNWLNRLKLSTSLRDPWGSPYLLDENELEGGNCNYDGLFSAGPDKIWGAGDTDGIIYSHVSTMLGIRIPFYYCR
ncbi:MAG: general secretion pathway protein G [Parcubacteria group bacterium Athens1014_10]|nr:MAG: general secretion pathway protein G [Parcubacteria group bacterium Athens1014_10]